MDVLKILLIILGMSDLCARELPDNLPDHVYLNNGTEAFTHRLYFALRNGKIYMKPNEKVTGIKSNWELVPFNGLPSSAKNLKPYPSVKFVSQIHADGDNLIALDQNSNIYYVKISHLIGFERPTKNLSPNWINEFAQYFNGKRQRNPGGKLFWKDKWGIAFFAKRFKVPKGNRGWAISHRGPYMEYYNDIDGNPQYISAGVTTLYALMPEGNEIQYIDPWLPPKWGKTAHKFYTPKKGRVVAKNLTSSGSTVFIITQSGHMYTRLYDWDSAGHDPFLQYTFKREKNRGSRGWSERSIIRTLPNEDWFDQPQILNGNITDVITIFQNGMKGNAGFTLRVEGKVGNQTGFFQKPIYGKAWQFIPDGHAIKRPFLLKSNNPPLTKPQVQPYIGTLYRGGIHYEVSLEDYHQEINPSYLNIKINNKNYKFPFYTRMTFYKKNNFYNTQGTVIVPTEVKSSSDIQVQRFHHHFFHGEDSLDLDISYNPGGRITIKEDLHILGVDEFVDVLVRTISKYHIAGMKQRKNDGYGVHSAAVRKSEQPSKIRARTKMKFCMPIYNTRMLYKYDCSLDEKKKLEGMNFIKGSGLKAYGESCMKNGNCISNLCDNNVVKENTGSFTCVPQYGLGVKDDYCTNNNQCSSKKCQKRQCL